MKDLNINFPFNKFVTFTGVSYFNLLLKIISDLSSIFLLTILFL